MNSLAKNIKIVKKGMDEENIKYFLSLTPKQRLEHLEALRTSYFKLNFSNDTQQGFQRVYNIVKRV